MDAKTLLECVQWPFCPGVFIAILAFVAAGVTFRDPGPREKALWTFLFLSLMCAEIAMMSLERHKRDTSEKAANDLEQQQSWSLSFLTFKSQSANSNLTFAKQQAKPTGNRQKTAEQIRVIAEAQTEADSANRALLLAMSSGIVNELRRLANKWDSDDHHIQSQRDVYLGAATKPSLGRNLTAEEQQRMGQQVQQIWNDSKKETMKLNEQSAREVIPALTIANNLREVLLQNSTLSHQDQDMATEFDKGIKGKMSGFSEMDLLARYMQKLVNR